MAFRFGTFLAKHRVLLFFFLLLFIVTGVSAFHEEYPDEYDSIVGGRYIAEGKVQYRDWFQHHQPGAYTVASIIYRFSGQSFVRMRIGIALVYFSLACVSFFILRKRIPELDRRLLAAGFLTIALSSTFFWGHMLLADSLSAYFLVVPLLLVAGRTLWNKPMTLVDLSLVSIFAFLAWWTSFTVSFMVAILFGFAFVSTILSGKHSSSRDVIKRILLSSVIVLGPFILFFLSLAVTQSLRDWVFANLTYNSRYYIYNYPRPYGTLVNPIRYAVVIAYTFIINYVPTIQAISFVPLQNPALVTAALGLAVLVLVAVSKRKYGLSLAMFGVFLFSTARSSPGDLKEMNYQAFPYFVLAIHAATLALGALYDSGKEKNMTQGVLRGVTFIILFVFYASTMLFFGQRFIEKVYPKYMGTMPLIYDRPEVAPLINQIVSKDEYAWVGPFEFKELLYLNTRVPSKYHWFLDHAKNSDVIREGMLKDFEKNKPVIIVFQRDFTPWGSDAATFNTFFTDVLDREYVRLPDINKQNTTHVYSWISPKTVHFDLNESFHIRKDTSGEIIDKLVSLGKMKQTPALVR